MQDLKAVDGSEIALLAMTQPALGQELSGAIGVPNVHTLVSQCLGARAATDEPALTAVIAMSSRLWLSDHSSSSTMPRQNTRLVVSNGKPLRRSKRSMAPKREMVPVPERLL